MKRIRAYLKFVPLCDHSSSQLYHVKHQVVAVEPEHIVEQMCFRLKFGQARPACAIWKRILDSREDVRLSHAHVHGYHRAQLYALHGYELPATCSSSVRTSTTGSRTRP